MSAIGTALTVREEAVHNAIVSCFEAAVRLHTAGLGGDLADDLDDTGSILAHDVYGDNPDVLKPLREEWNRRAERQSAYVFPLDAQHP